MWCNWLCHFRPAMWCDCTCHLLEFSDPPRLSLPSSLPSHGMYFSWGDLDSESSSHSLLATYYDVVHWSRKLFSLSFGNAGKVFVRELTRLFRSYAKESVLEAVALRAVIVHLFSYYGSPMADLNSEIM